MNVTAPAPQFFKFQIIGYEIKYPDVYMLGLGTIDDKNQFTGNLKHEQSTKDLTKKADYNAKSDPYCAWVTPTPAAAAATYSYFAVLVSSLPITNITLVKDEKVDPRPQTLDPEKVQTINADLLTALENIQWSHSTKFPVDGKFHHVCPSCEREPKQGHTDTCIVGNAIIKAKGL